MSEPASERSGTGEPASERSGTGEPASERSGTGEPGRSDRTPLAGADADAVGHLRTLIAEHGGPGTAVVEHLGRRGARIVVVAKDGTLGDAIVRDVPTGRDVCARAGIPVGEWDRELSAAVRITDADRRRMAGTGR